MPHIDMAQMVILALIAAAFLLLGVTLLAVSIYANAAKAAAEPVEDVQREVIPAKRSQIL